MRKFSYPALILLLVSFFFLDVPCSDAARQSNIFCMCQSGVRIMWNMVAWCLVFDVDRDISLSAHTNVECSGWCEARERQGIAASATTAGLCYSPESMIAIDAVSGKKIWTKTYDGGCDRMAIHLTEDLVCPTTRGNSMARW